MQAGVTKPAVGGAPTPDLGAAWRVAWHASVGSTSDVARAAALSGEPAGLWVMAERQTAGRGRLGRHWESPAGNFHGSLLLDDEAAAGGQGALSLVVGLALASAIQALDPGRIEPRLKWPNDVMLGPAKLAGILVERFAAASADRPGFVIVGIGVNLVTAPEGIGVPATSLAQAGLPGTAPADLLAALQPALAHHLTLWRDGGFVALRPAWLTLAHGLGTTLRVGVGQHRREGRFVGLGPDGALLLEAPSGEVQRIVMGEVAPAG